MEVREETKAAVYEALLSFKDWQLVPDLLKNTADAIESSCHNANIDRAREKNIPTFWEEESFVEQYSNIVYTVLINLDRNSSINAKTPESDLLVRKIFLATLCQNMQLSAASKTMLAKLFNLDLKQIGYMSSNELNPHINQHIYDEIETRNSQTVVVKTTEMYLCGRCKKRKAKYWKAQTRSGDEGYTYFVECQVCWFQWTIY
jgi:DNA-directed RNA polymerase subunit M/transcription elongation factor TFIIS